MDKKRPQIQDILFMICVMIFAAIGFVWFLNFLNEKLKIAWLIPLTIIGGYAIYFAIGLLLRDIRSGVGTETSQMTFGAEPRLAQKDCQFESFEAKPASTALPF